MLVWHSPTLGFESVKVLVEGLAGAFLLQDAEVTMILDLWPFLFLLPNCHDDLCDVNQECFYSHILTGPKDTFSHNKHVSLV